LLTSVSSSFWSAAASGGVSQGVPPVSFSPDPSSSCLSSLALLFLRGPPFSWEVSGLPCRTRSLRDVQPFSARSRDLHQAARALRFNFPVRCIPAQLFASFGMRDPMVLKGDSLACLVEFGTFSLTIPRYFPFTPSLTFRLAAPPSGFLWSRKTLGRLPFSFLLETLFLLSVYGPWLLAHRFCVLFAFGLSTRLPCPPPFQGKRFFPHSPGPYRSPVEKGFAPVYGLLSFSRILIQK